MRLTTTTNVSVDGVMQGLGGPDEDRSGGFERGGWAIPLLDTETGDYLNQVYGGAAAFLFGRRTYEIFAGSWGAMADASTSPIDAALNSRPKYVASTSLADPQWADTTVLHGDVATAVGDLKAHQDGTLLVLGSGALVRWPAATRDGRGSRQGHGRAKADEIRVTRLPRLGAGTGPELAGSSRLVRIRIGAGRTFTSLYTAPGNGPAVRVLAAKEA